MLEESNIFIPASLYSVHSNHVDQSDNEGGEEIPFTCSEGDGNLYSWSSGKRMLSTMC